MAFPTTQWTVVDSLKATDEAARREALGDIVTTYGPPLLVYAFRHSHGTRTPEDCEDVVNDFFLRCIQGGVLEVANKARGRFRSFLVTSFKYFLINADRSTKTKKRSPERGFVSWDAMSDALGSAAEPRTNETPEAAFERALRRALFDTVLGEFKRLCVARGDATQLELFLLREVKPVQDGTPVPTYGALAEQYAVASENRANKLVLAARDEFYALLLAKVTQDAVSPEDARAEFARVVATVAEG